MFLIGTVTVAFKRVICIIQSTYSVFYVTPEATKRTIKTFNNAEYHRNISMESKNAVREEWLRINEQVTHLLAY